MIMFSGGNLSNFFPLSRFYCEILTVAMTTNKNFEVTWILAEVYKKKV